MFPRTCAWNLWSSSAALRTHPSDTRCSCSPCQTAAYPSQQRWRWWCTVRRSGWTRPPLCSSWWWGYRWEISKTWQVWTLGAVWRISTWRDRTLLQLTILPTTKRRSENQNNSNHPESEKKRWVWKNSTMFKISKTERIVCSKNLWKTTKTDLFRIQNKFRFVFNWLHGKLYRKNSKVYIKSLNLVTKMCLKFLFSHRII